MTARPPLRLFGTLAASLALLALQFGLRAVGPHPLQQWLLAGAVASALALLAVAAVAVRARVYRVVGEEFHVQPWWRGQPEAAYPLTSLTAVGFTATRVLQRPLVEVAFAGAGPFRIPIRHEGGAELARFLFSQLGRNVQAENAA
jgi:hypothetical protein